MKKRRSNIEKLVNKIKDKNGKRQQQKKSNDGGQPFSTDINENEKFIKQKLGKSQDVMLTKFTISLQDGDTLNVTLVAIDSLVDEVAKRNNVLKPLKNHSLQGPLDENLTQIQKLISTKKITVADDLEKTINDILNSKALIIVDGYNKGLVLEMEGFEVRAIAEPETEQVVRGSREGFIESTGVNSLY